MSTHSHPTDTVTRQRFLDAFAGVLATSSANQTGEAWTGGPASTGRTSPAPGQELLTSALHFAGALEGTLILTVDRSTATEWLVRGTADEAGSVDAAWQRLLEHCQPNLERVFSALYGNTRITKLEPVAPSPTTPAYGIMLRRQLGEGVTLSVSTDPQLEGTLSVAEAKMQGGQRHAELQIANPPLERVVDVPLNVTLRFGQRHLTIREVLALTTGSLLELDRQVEEPVDLMLGERLIARGQVVIVDGNYGLRVTEVFDAGSRNVTRLIPEPPHKQEATAGSSQR